MWFQHGNSHTFIIPYSFLKKNIAVPKDSSTACSNPSGHTCWVDSLTLLVPLSACSLMEMSQVLEHMASLFDDTMHHMQMATVICSFPRNNPLSTFCFTTGFSSMTPTHILQNLLATHRTAPFSVALFKFFQRLAHELGSKCYSDSFQSTLCLSWKHNVTTELWTTNNLKSHGKI